MTEGMRELRSSCGITEPSRSMSLEFIVETPRGTFSMAISLPARGDIFTTPAFEPAAGCAVTGGASGAGAATTGAAFFFGAAFFCAVGAASPFSE